jgi:hypothetical protein
MIAIPVARCLAGAASPGVCCLMSPSRYRHPTLGSMVWNSARGPRRMRRSKNPSAIVTGARHVGRITRLIVAAERVI